MMFGDNAIDIEEVDIGYGSSPRYLVSAKVAPQHIARSKALTDVYQELRLEKGDSLTAHRAAVHEIGHGIEMQHPHIGIASHEYLRRAGERVPGKLVAYPKNGDVQPAAKTALDPYVHRVYPDGNNAVGTPYSEVFTRGAEAIFSFRTGVDAAPGDITDQTAHITTNMAGVPTTRPVGQAGWGGTGKGIADDHRNLVMGMLMSRCDSSALRRRVGTNLTLK